MWSGWGGVCGVCVCVCVCVCVQTLKNQLCLNYTTACIKPLGQHANISCPEFTIRAFSRNAIVYNYSDGLTDKSDCHEYSEEGHYSRPGSLLPAAYHRGRWGAPIPRLSASFPSSICKTNEVKVLSNKDIIMDIVLCVLLTAVTSDEFYSPEDLPVDDAYEDKPC